MSVKEIRQKTGLSQSKFAERYRIPLQTLKQWESSEGSSSHRKPPEYVEFLLSEVTQLSNKGEGNCASEKNIEPEMNAVYRKVPSDKVIHTIRAARDSRGIARLWLRYIAKQFEDHTTPLTSSELEYLLECDELTLFQKCALKRAYQSGAPTHQYVIKLGHKCDTSFASKLLERSRMNVRQ